MDPWDPTMLQPSSIDVRLDRYFRVFENHRYPHIDPAADQSDLTREVEPDGDELLQSEPRGLSSDRVEAGEHHRLGRIVDDEVDAGVRLEGADVPALPADDPALHVVGRKGEHGDGGLG